jgi:hypothetical protein
MNSILVVVADPGQPAKMVRIEGDHSTQLFTLQAAVGGHLEMVWLDSLAQNRREQPIGADSGVHLYVNEDGKALGLPPNLELPPYDLLVGPLVASKTDRDGNEAGLTGDEAVHVIRELDRLRGISK